VTSTGGGYFTSEPWHGFAWIATDSLGSTVTPTDFSAHQANAPFCASGSVVADSGYAGVAMIGFNLNQPESGGTDSEGVWAVTGAGVAYSLSNPGGSPLRLQIMGAAGYPTETWCALIDGTSGTIPWSSFNTACWNNSGTTYDPSIPLESIQITVPGGNATATAFDFCVNSLTLDNGGGAGGAGGTGGAAGTAGTAGTAGAAGTAGTAGTAGSAGKFVGNITTRNSCDTAGKTFSTYWDQVTPENAGKWGSVQPSASSQFGWSTLDAIYDYSRTHNILFKQHTFVWGSQQPSGNLTEANVKNWIQSFCSRYPNTKLIDVVNEPPPHTTPSYANAIGGGTDGNWQWITNAFTWARQYCPGAILILNDYNNIEWSPDNAHFIDIVKKIKAAGAPIDAVGAQSHDLDHPSVSFNTAKSLIAKLHNDTGLPVYITEFDISTADDQAQLTTYQQYFPFFLSTDYVKGVTIWGWIYGETWDQAPDSGLIRNGTARPAMTWLMQTLGRPQP